MNRQTSLPFHLMIKPTGAVCNLACEYCYYLHKAEYYPGSQFRMNEATLERVTAAYMQVHPGPEITFGWQGGEPLLMGVDFFRKALEFQGRYRRPGVRVVNAIQTNGTLIDDDWAAFFAEQHFLVGISIDGPAYLHDHYRRNRAGHATHANVLAGLAALQHHQAEYNTLVTVNRTNVEHPLEIYRTLTDLGVEFLQFIPIVEREALGSRKVTNFSVRADAFGTFLCEVFDYWALHDVGRVYVQLFENTLSVWLGNLPGLCVFAPVCGQGLVVEHTGDLYACDHFVYPEHRRGAITTPESLYEMVESPEQRAFGLTKADVSAVCRNCPVVRFCGGDCPKHRIRLAEDGKPMSYLCAAYRRFFEHSANVMQAMAGELRAGRSPANVMEVLRMLKP